MLRRNKQTNMKGGEEEGEGFGTFRAGGQGKFPSNKCEHGDMNTEK